MLQHLSALIQSPNFHALCLAVIVLASVVAVLSHLYDDTLSQRIGLGVVAMGAAVQLSLTLETGYTSPGLGIMLAGVAFYAVATAVKIGVRWRRAGKPANYGRRSTDFGTFPDTAPAPRGKNAE